MGKRKPIAGRVPLRFTGKSLYFVMDGGTFTAGKVSGTFAPTVGGAAMVIYVHAADGEHTAYECRTEDIIKAALADHRRRAKQKPKHRRSPRVQRDFPPDEHPARYGAS